MGFVSAGVVIAGLVTLRSLPVSAVTLSSYRSGSALGSESGTLSEAAAWSALEDALPHGWQRSWSQEAKALYYYKVDEHGQYISGSETLTAPSGLELQYNDWPQSVVHMCSLVFGEKAVAEMEMLLRSVSAQRANQTFIFHVLTSGLGIKNLTDLIGKYRFIPDVRPMSFDYYLNKTRQMKVAFNPQYTMVGNVKPFMFERFGNVRRCLMHDTDMYFVRPPSELWDRFKEQDTDDRRFMTAIFHPGGWFGDRLNSGVMLLDFDKMRRAKFGDALLKAHWFAANAVLENERMNAQLPEGKKIFLGPGNKVNATDMSIYTVWGDQAIYHWALMALENQTDPSAVPKALNLLNSSWNLEMCKEFEGFCGNRSRDSLTVNAYAGGVDQRYAGNLHLNCHWSQGFWWQSEVFQTKYLKCFEGMMSPVALARVKDPYNIGHVNMHRLDKRWMKA